MPSLLSAYVAPTHHRGRASLSWRVSNRLLLLRIECSTVSRASLCGLVHDLRFFCVHYEEVSLRLCLDTGQGCACSGLFLKLGRFCLRCELLSLLLRKC